MKERIVSLGILLFALVYLAGSISLKVGTLAQPGAGQFPAAIAFCLLAVSAYHVWRTFQKKTEKETNRGRLQIAPLGIAVILALYPVLLKTGGFLLSTFIVLFSLFRLLRFKTIPVSLLIALCMTLLAFMLFAGALGVVVPGGFIEEIFLKMLERG